MCLSLLFEARDLFYDRVLTTRKEKAVAGKCLHWAQAHEALHYSCQTQQTRRSQQVALGHPVLPQGRTQFGHLLTFPLLVEMIQQYNEKDSNRNSPRKCRQSSSRGCRLSTGTDPPPGLKSHESVQTIDRATSLSSLASLLHKVRLLEQL